MPGSPYYFLFMRIHWPGRVFVLNIREPAVPPPVRQQEQQLTRRARNEDGFLRTVSGARARFMARLYTAVSPVYCIRFFDCYSASLLTGYRAVTRHRLQRS